MPNNQVKFNVAIISNVHIYQFFFFWGGGRGVVGQIDFTFYSFIFSLGGGVWSKEVKS